MIKKSILLLSLFLCYAGAVSAQKLAVKTDLLQWATTTPNLAGEVALAPRLTFAAGGAYNPWTFADNKKLRHWAVESELKYWFWESFNGHFLGVHGQYAEFNAGGIKLPFSLLPDLADFRYEGDTYSAALTYGYQWMLAPRWGIEASIGLGYRHTRYRQYQCRTCGLPVGPDGKPEGESPLQTKHYYGPTRAAISFIYLIR